MRACMRRPAATSHTMPHVQVHVWKDALSHKQKAAYMHHRLDGRAVASLRFCPYEDVLAIGHAAGLSTILVPGAGEPNFDSLVADPYQTGKQRQEQEVHQLMDKLQPAMITLDPTSVAKVCARERVAGAWSAMLALGGAAERAWCCHVHVPAPKLRADACVCLEGERRAAR